MVDAEKPFFLYFCPGACHSPHQPPPAYLEAYRGAFDEGWDVARERTFARQLAEGLLPSHTELSPRPDWVPAWDELSADDQRLFARYMEAFAGFLTHTDAQVGRLLDALRETGDFDDTLVMVLSDNGASSEGGATGSLNDVRLWNGARTTRDEALARIDEIGGPFCHNNYPWGWTVAGNTPFRRWKREVHEGGVADPLIVSWPAGFAARGEVRSQYVHAVDVAPTLLDVAGVAEPAVVAGVPQRPMDGRSFAGTFADAAAPPPRTRQYYEMFGCRALYDDGWKAVTYHPIQSDDPGLPDATWELYDLRADPSECHDLAEAEPERLAALVELWWREAERNQVLPLDNRPFSAFVTERPSYLPERSRYAYYPARVSVPEPAAVNVRNRNHRITAHVTVDGPCEGVLLAQGSRLGGWSLFVQDGRLRYVHNYVGLRETLIEGPVALAPGEHTLGFAFDRTADHAGTGTLLVDGAAVASGRVTAFTPVRFSLLGAGLSCGRDVGLPVSSSYDDEFPFTGGLSRVVVEVDSEPWVDPEEEAAAVIAAQ
jgi:arylsulfatase